MRKRILGIVITVWWLAMMATLLHRYVIQHPASGDATPLDTAALADAWIDTDEWMALRWNLLPIGVMRTVARRIQPEETGAPTPETSTQHPRHHVAVLIGIAVGEFQARVTTTALLNERLILDQFRVLLHWGVPDTPGFTQLNIDGLAEGTTLRVRFQRGDAVQFKTVKLARPVALAESLRPLYSRADLRVGDSFTVPVFDPIWNMQGATLTVNVAARETLRIGNESIDTLRIETRVPNLTTTTWVDDSGMVRKRSIPPLDMIAISRAQAVGDHPWMADLPPVPALSPKELQGEDRGEPLGANGFLGLLQDSLSPVRSVPQTDSHSTSPQP